MTTLLEQTNKVLTLLNEQTVETVTESNVSLKVKDVLEQAIYQTIMANNQWPWLQSIIASTAWSDEKATLASSVLDVKYIRNEQTIIAFVDNKEFFSTATTTGTPTCYTRVGNTYYFNPYPDNATARDLVKFHVIQTPNLPQSDNDAYDAVIPLEFFELFRAIAVAELAMVHLGDAQMSNFYQRKSADLLAILKSKRIGEQLDVQSMIAEGEGDSVW